ncbi:hypothetical protein QFC19_000120 [Naganishia cerealis]|uniref:Uncharacterized protein n=1 Tax=Naganishia cerealis TaxID=610337 RepID=A0ACC2WRX4_9TREE|nr:hypothetical protein QFC19_000120 [Naganishia cerealis]
MAIQNAENISEDHPPHGKDLQKDLQPLAEKLRQLSEKTQELAAGIQGEERLVENYAVRILQDLVRDIAGIPAGEVLRYTKFQNWGAGILVAKETQFCLRYYNVRHDAISTQVAGNDDHERKWKGIRDIYKDLLQRLDTAPC